MSLLKMFYTNKKLLILYNVHRLEKCISLVDYEKNKIDNINTSVTEFFPEFQEKIEDAKSQIEQLDVSHQRLKHCRFFLTWKSKIKFFF